jgi:probable F420-dependent oxidoreductase
MKVDGALEATKLLAVPEVAERLETLGYDGTFTFEGPHDPFFPLLLAAEHTERLTLTTAIAIAFARNPMTLAQLAYDLQLASNGRMELGLGTQIQPHITKRFSMPWSQPAARMREMVLAIRAIWASWNDGARLDFRGEFYTHTLMTPMFNPGPSPSGVPRLLVAGVGPRMTEVAGEVADGFMVHPFTTPEFLRTTTLPAIERGLATAGRARGAFEISLPAMVAVADTDAGLARERESFKARIAFYGSTPAYKIVLEAHGWGDLQPELNRMTKTNDWAAMPSLITDEIVDTFVVCARTDELAARLTDRFGGLVDRLSVNPPKGVDPAKWSEVVATIRRSGAH